MKAAARWAGRRREGDGTRRAAWRRQPGGLGNGTRAMEQGGWREGGGQVGWATT